MGFGLLVSAFARTELQTVQFMPAFVMPQLLPCGLFAPLNQMASALEAVSYALPMTYAYDALEQPTSRGALGASSATSIAVPLGATLVALALGAAALQRRTP